MLELMRKAFRTTMSGGNGKTYEMHFAFRSMEDMHKADDEWRAFCESKQDNPKPVGGWIVADANEKRFRVWRKGWSEWTANRDEATRYARREDAEAVHAEDDDAWCVLPYHLNPLENCSMDELSRELHNRGWRLIPAFVAKNLATGLNHGFWAKEPNND